MASPIVPSTGLGSGLDITSIVNALVGADMSAGLSQNSTQVANTTASLSGLSQLQSALATYQTALTSLSSTTTPAFAGFSATSSTPATLTTTSDNTAVNGNYNIVVTNLATSSKVASASFSGGVTSAIPTGTLQVSQNGTDYNVAIPSGSTLQSVRDAINTSLQGNGITANIVTDSNGSRLVLGSTATGAGSDISTSGIAGLEISGSTLMDGTSTGAGYIGAPAADALYTVDGLSVTSKTNTVSPISGLTMTLVGAGSSTVTVATNTTGLQTSVQSFVTAYNALVTTVNSLTAPGTVDSTGTVTGSGAMSGDSLPRSLLASLQKQLVTPGASSQLSVLSQLGVTTNEADGTLTLDSTQFTTAMTTKNLGSQVQALFNGTNGSGGLIASMGAVLTPYTQTGGILAMRTTTLNTTQSNLADQLVALTQQQTDLTATLTAKYNAMDLVVGQLKATATSLTSFFASLTASTSSG
jgi:flagellar hook-associated protein 2